MDSSYPALLAVLGVAVISAAMLRRVVSGLPLSLPILYLGVGVVLFALPFDLQGPSVTADDQAAERLTELVVIVSLMGAGLKLDRPPGRRAWATTWRLLGVAMLLTIAAVALLGLVGLGLGAASAILLGAVIAPTDPVLASDVQVEGPSEGDADDEVRFALTSEAGLNDGLAFPFTNLAIAVAAGGAWFGGWVLEDVLLRLTMGFAAGWLLGRAVAWVAFRFRSRTALARTSDGFVVVGATLAIYGITELVHGYGFLAVFVAAVTIRGVERDHEFHRVMHGFAETAEHLASIVFLLLLGGALVDGGLAALTPAGAVVAVAVVLVIRPLSGWLSLLGTATDRGERAAIAFFGIRGMGTVYYLAHAATEEAFPGARQVWAVALLVIVVSVVLHGVSAGVALERIDRRRARGAWARPERVTQARPPA